MFGVYQNPDLSDNIFECLLTAMAKVLKSVDIKAYFLLVFDVNAHHEEWLGSYTTNLHGRVVRDFSSLSGCEQMVTELTPIGGEVFDLVLTDVPDVVGVRVGSPVGTCDHSAVFMDVVLEQPNPHLVCRQENSVGWELVRGDVKGPNWNGITRSLCPVSRGIVAYYYG